MTGQHVCHTETIDVTLGADSRGFGLTLQENPFSIAEPPIIGAIEPRGPAEKYVLTSTTVSIIILFSILDK